VPSLAGIALAMVHDLISMVSGLMDPQQKTLIKYFHFKKSKS
jgi:hypothetical protein